jgi:hypothetical protein
MVLMSVTGTVALAAAFLTAIISAVALARLARGKGDDV